MIINEELYANNDDIVCSSGRGRRGGEIYVRETSSCDVDNSIRKKRPGRGSIGIDNNGGFFKVSGGCSGNFSVKYTSLMYAIME